LKTNKNSYFYHTMKNNQQILITLLFVTIGTILADSPLQCPSCTSYMSMDDCTRNEKTIDCGTSLTRSNYSCITSETFIPPTHTNKKGALVYEKRCAKLDKCREKDVCSAYGKCKFTCCQSDCLTKEIVSGAMNLFFNSGLVVLASVFCVAKLILM